MIAQTPNQMDNNVARVTAPDQHEQGREAGLRAAAVKHLERVRKLKLDIAAYLFGSVVIGAVWAITEYQNSGGWPQRLSDNGGPGDWNPWILWVVLGWGFLVGLDVLKTYFRRPTTEAEIEREIARLQGR